MKKVIILLLLVSSTISGQISIAVTGGLNYTNTSSNLFEYEYSGLIKVNKFQTFGNFGFELNYFRANLKIGTGLAYSNRGTREYNAYVKNYTHVYRSDYIELPIQLSYSYCKRKFDSGIGFGLHYKLNTGIMLDDYNRLFGLDFRLSSSWNLNRHLAIVPSYTFGNLDKYVSNTKNVYLHHVFALNLRYTFKHL
ncbi:MAG: outer membrane beta-barrel protein [Saprospiraceae bacterium]